MLAHNIADLIQSSAGTTLDLSIDDSRADVSPEIELAEPVVGTARLHRTQSGVIVQVQAKTAVRLECSRCLEPIVQPLQIKFVEEFLIEAPGVEIDPDAFQVDEHHVLDLREALRQYLTLAVPLAPLCRPDCAGLCANCGAPLVDGHECVRADFPTGPFAALSKLKDQTQ